MKRLFIAAAVAGSAMLTAVAPASASTFYDYGYVKRPYSGFYSVGRHSVYCDYVKLPKRHCVYKTRCHHGKCYKKQHCKVVGFRYKQHCY